ncbi:MAG TPA: pseudouridine synthase, partial [Solimonas sp.]|nr:pseudouridine synthase [Solimonas sp.]
MSSPPIRDGVGASELRLPAGTWPSLLAFLQLQFPAIGVEVWRSRLQRGLVTDESGRTLDEAAPYVAGLLIHYYRELPPEPVIPFEAQLLYQDAHLVVADKPHFLPVVPAGRYLQQTLLVRLKKALGLEQLVPLHRIDRGTAGLVLFSADPASRGQYQSLFARREVAKTYEALAPALPTEQFPLLRRSRIV